MNVLGGPGRAEWLGWLTSCSTDEHKESIEWLFTLTSSSDRTQH